VKLTQRTISGLALPEGRAEAIFFDDDIPGFGLRLRDGGSRNWVFQYKLGVKQRRLTLGSVNAVNPAKARDKAGDLYAMVRLGRDPAGDRAEGRTRAGETFEPIMRRFLARQKARMKPRSYLEVERHLLAHCKPLHGLPLATVERRTVAARLSAIAESSGPVAANRARASLSAFFAWAVREGVAEVNPVIGTNKQNEITERDRALTDPELREVWLALNDDHYGDMVRLLMLTGQRRAEIGSLEWSEIDLDRDLLRLPAERTKNNRPHEVPLCGAARVILQRQPKREGRGLVFGEGQGGFSGWGHAKAAVDRRILENRREAATKPGADASKVKPMVPWRLHDLRRTAATRMGDLGVQPHVIEAVLNHVSGHKAGVAGVYNRSTYSAEKVAALALWAEHVMAIVTDRPSNVVALRFPA